MRLFLDTNVLLDHALVRSSGQPYEVKQLISWAYENSVDLIVSPGSFYTFAYVLEKSGIVKDDLKAILKKYLSVIDVANTTKDTFLNGLDSTFTDLEDSFQYMTAIQKQCDYLITSNLKDFKSAKNDKIAIISPAAFVTKVIGKKKA
jgi:predicted nucleic acid-binding protein